MERVVRMLKKQFKGDTKNESWKEASPREFYPMNPIQRGTCLRPTSPSKGIAQTEKLQEGNLNGETQRGLGKHGNIPPLTNVGRFDVEISC
ncbi:hypothetical protein TNCT_490651 [Trichonephila clavata]|uniref:Uncharacterized protein n=1 Tax=Trichonephila clavata TaxID=2740835 RepID=A0A8X6LKG7_TRICU|nr:hypothetical protein TNCT_490651 [Trichonephila clavata]